MKIYHTETQADYDALMVELERLGIQTLEKRLWKENDNQTVVLVRAIGRYIDNRTDTTFGGLARALKNHPRVPIIKYKAKAEDKMRFNKQSIERAFDKFMQGGNDSFADLKERIINLVDEPEKVVVPKFVADYLEERKRDGDGLVTSLYPFQGNSGELIEDWFEEEENNVSFARAWIDGYTIEPEPQYIVSIMDLGIDRIILMKNKLGYSVELESENDGHWEVHFTEQQIKEYDKRYWAFAIPVEGKK